MVFGGNTAWNLHRIVSHGKMVAQQHCQIKPIVPTRTLGIRQFLGVRGPGAAVASTGRDRITKRRQAAALQGEVQTKTSVMTMASS